MGGNRDWIDKCRKFRLTVLCISREIGNSGKTENVTRRYRYMNREFAD